jgi:aspartate/methionine/tyrosine aminotransferase
MMREAFARRGSLMQEMLNKIPGVSCMAPQGAFYCFPDFSGLLNRNLSGATAATTLELADLVLDRVKVAFVPGEAFGLPRYARFSFALGDDDLREGISRLASFVNS